mmetsp:Transcript_35302/g.85617  ORF Transcript_35302/g.85617 Transcript_35302/m.85617 type:complete len:188 (+) Transcript_35302:1998-2561(+)
MDMHRFRTTKKSMLECWRTLVFPPCQKDRREFGLKSMMLQWNFGSNTVTFWLLDPSEDPILLDWVQSQRLRYRQKAAGVGRLLSKLEIYLLDRIGFPWESNRIEVEWQMQYNELAKFWMGNQRKKSEGVVKVSRFRRIKSNSWRRLVFVGQGRWGDYRYAPHQTRLARAVGTRCHPMQRYPRFFFVL